MHSDRRPDRARAAALAATLAAGRAAGRAAGLAPLLLCACLDPIPNYTLTPREPPGSGTLTGSVTDYCVGSPLAGAQVSARRDGAPLTETPRIADTNDRGAFTLEGLTAGRWTVTVAKSKYQTADWSYEVRGDGVLSVELALTPVPTSPPSSVTLDVLFVIDNSNSMETEQATLASAFPSFMDALLASRVALDLHIGVISTDMGAGSYSLPSCERLDGDGGKLQSTPRLAGCTGPSASFITATTAATAGGPLVLESNLSSNSAPALYEAFACIAQLGTGGCGFEQPLAALRRAVGPKTNPGFLRANAALAIIVLSDEDDCSAQNGQLFDPASGPQGVYVPLTSYRCFQFGVTCDRDAGVPGPRQSCTPGWDYLLAVETVADELKALRPQGRRHLAVIGGPPEPVQVGLQGGNLVLEPSCQLPTTIAAPAIRMSRLVELLRPASSFDSICASDLRNTLASIATRIVNTTLLDPCKK